MGVLVKFSGHIATGGSPHLAYTF